MDAQRRRSQYRNASVPKPWLHMVFLAFGMDRDEAWSMEKAVQDELTKRSKRDVTYCATTGPVATTNGLEVLVARLWAMLLPLCGVVQCRSLIGRDNRFRPKRRFEMGR